MSERLFERGQKRVFEETEEREQKSFLKVRQKRELNNWREWTVGDVVVDAQNFKQAQREGQVFATSNEPLKKERR